MLIVSQDKISIYNFDNIKSIDVIEKEIYITDNILAGAGACIGEYETEERTKEILQEIVTAYTGDGVVENEGYVCFEMPEK